MRLFYEGNNAVSNCFNIKSRNKLLTVTCVKGKEIDVLFKELTKALKERGYAF